VQAVARPPLSTPPTWRWWRWLAELPGESIAFAADDDDAWTRLVREAMLLDLLRPGVLAVPEVTATDAVRRVQVRRKVLGQSGVAVEALAFGAEEALGSDRYRADFPISGAGRCLSADPSRALAELTGPCPRTPQTPPWPR
jgi:hypothetical protein